MMHRKFMWTFYALTLLSSTTAGAQTLDAILAKNYRAHGGLARIKSKETVHIKGRMVMQGVEFPLNVYGKRPSFYRSELTVRGHKIVQGYDGQSGWMINPMWGSKDPIDMPADELISIKEQADMDGFLIDWKAKGHKLKLIGKEDVDGTDAYHIEVTTKEGDLRHIYIDVDSYLQIQQKGKYPAQGNEVEIIASMGDYRMVDSLMIPFSTEVNVNGKTLQQVLLDTIEYNVPISDSLFERPKLSR
jgi:hypothetical protein